MRRDFGERFDESDDGVGLHPVEHADTRPLERRATQGLELESSPQPAAQRGRHGRSVGVGRRLPGRDVDPGHGRAAASGEALIASATR